MSTGNEQYLLKKEGNLWVTEVLGNRYGFKKWSWGEKNAASSKSTYINPINGLVEYRGDIFNVTLLTQTVFREEDGKFVAFTEDEANKLDNSLADRLFQITQKMNLVSTVETRNL